MFSMRWPYPVECDKTERVKTDVLVIGGGISGCMAAISAARKGLSVTIWKRGRDTKRRRRVGLRPLGIGHDKPLQLRHARGITRAMLDDNDGYNNGISII
jgi:glycine/D-amino acid oxidase-like deaminating enzyme